MRCHTAVLAAIMLAGPSIAPATAGPFAGPVIAVIGWHPGSTPRGNAPGVIEQRP